MTLTFLCFTLPIRQATEQPGLQAPAKCTSGCSAVLNCKSLPADYASIHQWMFLETSYLSCPLLTVNFYRKRNTLLQNKSLERFSFTSEVCLPSPSAPENLMFPHIFVILKQRVHIWCTQNIGFRIHMYKNSLQSHLHLLFFNTEKITDITQDGKCLKRAFHGCYIATSLAQAASFGFFLLVWDVKYIGHI